jgi:7-cyano-7-deazaguanine synthase in queuosine biosynthesis
VYARILRAAVSRLRDDRFAAIVVGDVRADGGAGPLLPFVQDTIMAMEGAGLRLYNDAVCLAPAGTLPLRAGRTFRASRKLGRQHARLLVFVKGDWRRAVEACGAADVPLLLPTAEVEPEPEHEVDTDEPTPLASEAPATLVVRDPSASDDTETATPHPLVWWMERLYRRAADWWTLCGDLGEWPSELGDYLEGLCLAYSREPAHITLRDGLLAPLDEGASSKRPYHPERLLLLFSGGKDSTAAGILAARRGFDVHAAYVRRINRSYPNEEGYARRAADLLGWPFTAVDVAAKLPKPIGESVVKNQYALSLALSALDYVPGAVGTGDYSSDDCHVTTWYSDMQASYRLFAPALASATHMRTRYVELLQDDLEPLLVWWRETAPAVKACATSCMMPERHKPQHRRRNLEKGVPLFSEYDCGSCEKCLLRAVLLTLHLDPGDEAPHYPPDYLAKARKRLAKGIAQQEFACAAHPLLESTAVPDSAAHLLRHTFAGMLGGVEPKRNRREAVAPILVRQETTEVRDPPWW